MGGDHRHHHARMFGAQCGQPHQTLAVGHVQVEQDHVDVRILRELFLQLRQRTGFQHHDVGHHAAQCLRQGQAKQRVVIGDQQARHAHTVHRCRLHEEQTLRQRVVPKYDAGRGGFC